MKYKKKCQLEAKNCKAGCDNKLDEFIKDGWTKEPERFKIKPLHYNLKAYKAGALNYVFLPF